LPRATLDRTDSESSPETAAATASGRLNARKSISASGRSTRNGSATETRHAARRPSGCRRRLLRRFDRPDRDGRDEAVAAPADGLDVARRRRAVAECSAQAIHSVVQAVVEIDERAEGPETLAQLVARDEDARTLDEGFEQTQWLVLQADLCLVFPQFGGIAIQLERTESNCSRRAFCHHLLSRRSSVPFATMRSSDLLPHQLFRA
jgi:hypothetical protein